MSQSSDRIRLVVLFGGGRARRLVRAAHVLRAAEPGRYEPVAIGITREGQWVVAEDAVASLEAGAAGLPETLSAEGPDVEPQAALVPPTPVRPWSSSRCSTARWARTAPSRACSSSWALRTWGPGCSARRSPWTRPRPRRSWPRPASRRPATGPSGTWRWTPPSWRAVDELGLPALVKPANLGSSIGVTKVHTLDELHAAVELALSYDEWVLIEEAIEGREIELSVLGNTDLRVSVPGEVRPAAEFYDYEDKYLDGRAELIIPAAPDPVTARFQDLASPGVRALRAGWDGLGGFLYEGENGGSALNEINTIPGFTPISMTQAQGGVRGSLQPAHQRAGAVGRRAPRAPVEDPAHLADVPVSWAPDLRWRSPPRDSFGEGPRGRRLALVLRHVPCRQVMALARRGGRGCGGVARGRSVGGHWLADGRLLVVAMRTRRLLRLDSDGLAEVADMTPHAPSTATTTWSWTAATTPMWATRWGPLRRPGAAEHNARPRHPGMAKPEWWPMTWHSRTAWS